MSMSIEDHLQPSAWRLRIPLIVGALAGAGALTQVGLPTDAQAYARGVGEQAVRPGASIAAPAVPDLATLRPGVGTAAPAAEFPAAELPAAGIPLEPPSGSPATLHRQPGPPHDGAAVVRERRPVELDRHALPWQRVEQTAIATHIARTWRVDEAEVRRYVSLAWDGARQHGLDPVLVLAIIATESSFNPRARSGAGAEGLMQVHTRVHKDKLAPHGGVRAVFDPAVNIQVGIQILKHYLDRYGRVQSALKAYVGAANLAHDHGYARKVLARRTEFRGVIRSGLIAARERDVRAARAASEAAEVMSGSRFTPRS
ncbi:MAG: transglycosylase SLT domain-containing protein [Lautropia sp.]